MSSLAPTIASKMRPIKSIVLSLWIVLLYWAGQPVQAADPVVKMIDPLLGLHFDPRIIRFEPAPEGALRALRYGRGQNWLFASYDDSSQSGNRYFIIAGLVPTQLDTEPPRESDKLSPNFGVVYAVKGNSYKALGVPDLLYDDKEPLVSERVMLGLTHDAVARLISAFGGNAALQKVLSKEPGQDTIPKPLVEALRRAGISVDFGSRNSPRRAQ